MRKFLVAMILASSTAYVGSSLLKVSLNGELVATNQESARDGMSCAGGALSLPSCSK